MQSKRGQAIIWILFGVGIVILIMSIFLLNKKIRGGETEEFYNSDNFIKQCVRKEVLKVVDDILPKGGFASPKIPKIYDEKPIEYLCLNKGNYLSCINHHPNYIEEVRLEIKNNMEDGVRNCFSQLKDLMSEKNIQMSEGELGFDVLLANQRIIVEINKEITFSKESIQKIDGFRVEVASPLYELLKTAVEIVNNEARSCYFEYAGYMMLYHDLIIEKKTLGDSTRLYYVEDKASKKKLAFAVRGCAIPAGI